MLAWLAPVLVFGLVVLVHELGHFVAAKWVGVYAPRFSIGFGPVLWRRRRGETEYVLSALPLGGYVRMASREDEASAFLEGGAEESAGSGSTDGASKPADWDPEAMVPFGPKPVPPDRWFESKPLWARLVIMIAGVVMNVVLALAVSTGVFATYGRDYRPAVIDSVVAGRPAARAGLLAGDSIVAVDGRAVTRWDEVVERVTASPGKPIDLTVSRSGARRSFAVTPELVEEKDPETSATVRLGRIGAAVGPRTAREDVGLGRSFVYGWDATWRMAGLIIDILGGLFTGQVSVSNLGGPIEIARTSVAAAKSGFESLLSLIALLSINVAVFNLLPIPILDGGQMLLVIAERLTGGSFSARTREYIARVGLAAIGLLFVIVMFNDIKRLLGFA